MKFFQRGKKNTDSKIPIKKNHLQPLKDDSELKTIEISDPLTPIEIFSLPGKSKNADFFNQNEQIRRSDHIKSEAEEMSIPEQYNFALGLVIAERFEKAEFLENKIENMIEQQITQLRQLKSNKPSLFSLSNQKKVWNQNVTKQQTTINRLRERLRAVHEIKEKVTHEGPTLELFARKKLKYNDPILVAKYIIYLEEERKKKLKKKLLKTNVHTRPVKRGLKLKLT